LSNDKRFVEKLQDVVGLYLCPPDKALVLSVEEKSQVQALDRIQPGLPMKKGRAGTSQNAGRPMVAAYRQPMNYDFADTTIADDAAPPATSAPVQRDIAAAQIPAPPPFRAPATPSARRLEPAREMTARPISSRPADAEETQSPPHPRQLRHPQASQG
jgi:hypothetical protein